MSEYFHSYSVKIKPTYRILGIAGAIVFSLLALYFWQLDDSDYIPLLFLLFVPIFIFISLISGEIKIDENTIYYKIFFSEYKIDWSEVKRIERSPGGIGIYFIGEGKYLSLLSEQYWSIKDRAKVLALILKMTKRLNIPTRPISTSSLFRRTGKNTKIK